MIQSRPFSQFILFVLLDELLQYRKAVPAVQRHVLEIKGHQFEGKGKAEGEPKPFHDQIDISRRTLKACKENPVLEPKQLPHPLIHWVLAALQGTNSQKSRQFIDARSMLE
ncbi:hypothetical protein HG530_013861 [Fusarium avenaceum]|nr:hypothetical protein HG530_013861 [Fusarium avenaceum]